jgi:hypothetical protein
MPAALRACATVRITTRNEDRGKDRVSGRGEVRGRFESHSPALNREFALHNPGRSFRGLLSKGHIPQGLYRSFCT